MPVSATALFIFSRILSTKASEKSDQFIQFRDVLTFPFGNVSKKLLSKRKLPQVETAPI